jgi:hypothetical protein
MTTLAKEWNVKVTVGIAKAIVLVIVLYYVTESHFFRGLVWNNAAYISQSAGRKSWYIPIGIILWIMTIAGVVSFLWFAAKGLTYIMRYIKNNR